MAEGVAASPAAADHAVDSCAHPNGAAVIIRADLAAFFDSIPAGRIWNLLRIAGLPEGVARTVTGLVSTVVPAAVLHTQRAQLDPASLSRARVPHLPIGAPTSPALANLLCYALDRRLAGLAERFGATYTRYVDDLTFSGGAYLRTRRARFVELADQIVRAEGFSLNDRKTGRTG